MPHCVRSRRANKEAARSGESLSNNKRNQGTIPVVRVLVPDEHLRTLYVAIKEVETLDPSKVRVHYMCIIPFNHARMWPKNPHILLHYDVIRDRFDWLIWFVHNLR